MGDPQVILITGTSRGIGRDLAGYYSGQGHTVIGCSRKPPENGPPGYEHHCLDVTDEIAVLDLFRAVRKGHGRLDALINNAGIASMNHSLLTPVETVRRILDTNVTGTFLFCREAAKLMRKKRRGRIVNFVTIATPLNLEGESVYAASKAAVMTLTRILAREFAELGITVNAVGPTPVSTDLIRGVPEDKIKRLLGMQVLQRMTRFEDIRQVVDFFLHEGSDFITGQILYLGGVS